jgi:hypothetical protein
VLQADGACLIRVGNKRSSKEYLQQWCDAVVGASVAVALQRHFLYATGQVTAYRSATSTWVQVLTEAGLVICVRVATVVTKNHWADILTKKPFIEIRDKIAHYCPG